MDVMLTRVTPTPRPLMFSCVPRRRVFRVSAWLGTFGFRDSGGFGLSWVRAIRGCVRGCVRAELSSALCFSCLRSWLAWRVPGSRATHCSSATRLWLACLHRLAAPAFVFRGFLVLVFRAFVFSCVPNYFAFRSSRMMSSSASMTSSFVARPLLKLSFRLNALVGGR
jgi:hypothetical protein